MKKEKYDLIVSLGAQCSCSQLLRSLNLQDYSFPFDWLGGGELKTRVNLVINNFKDFLNLEDLELIGNKIQSIEFNDGNPIIANFIFNPFFENVEIDFCDSIDTYHEELNYFLNISSGVHLGLAGNSETYDFFMKHPNYKFLFVNSKNSPKDLIGNLYKI